MSKANSGIAARPVPHLRSDAAAPALSGPSWLAASCPPWCVQGHREAESYDDRTHDSQDRRTPLSLAEQIEDDMPRAVAAALCQHYRDTAPRIIFAHGERQDEAVYLTLDEAERIGRDLLALVAAGRASLAAEAGTAGRDQNPPARDGFEPRRDRPQRTAYAAGSRAAVPQNPSQRTRRRTVREIITQPGVASAREHVLAQVERDDEAARLARIGGLRVIAAEQLVPAGWITRAGGAR